MERIGLWTLALFFASQAAFTETIPELRLLGTSVGAMPPLQVVVEATVVEIQDSGTVVIRSHRGGLHYRFTWRDSIPLRAKTRRDFGGRYKLSFEDLAVGQKLKIRLRNTPRRIDKITVLRTAEGAPPAAIRLQRGWQFTESLGWPPRKPGRPDACHDGSCRVSRPGPGSSSPPS